MASYISGSLYAPFQQQKVAQLSEADVLRVSDSFKKEVALLNYNSLSPFLELCAWIREQGADRHWGQLLETLPLSAKKLVVKYRGGTPALVAIAAQEMLQGMGYQGNVIGQARTVPKFWFYPEPSVYKPKMWEAARDHSHGYSHLLCVLPYRDPQQQEKGLVLQHTFTQEPSVQAYPSWAMWEEEFRRSSTLPMHVFTEPVKYVKATMGTHLTLHVLCKEKKEKCILNLLEGTLSVEPGEIPHLPKNLDGKSLFKISDLLAQPFEKKYVSIDGTRANLNNQEIFGQLLNAIQQGFGLPEDFQENFVFLMQNQNRLFSEIIFPPAAALQSIWPQYQHVDLLRRQTHFIVSDSPSQYLFEGNKAFDLAIACIERNKEEDAKSAFKNAEQLYQKAMTEKAGKMGTPVDVLLQDF